MHYPIYSSQQSSEVVILCSYFQFADANPIGTEREHNCPKTHSLRFIPHRKLHFHSLVKLDHPCCMPTSGLSMKVLSVLTASSRPSPDLTRPGWTVTGRQEGVRH